MDLKNTVTYTLPPRGEEIGTSGVFVKGSFTVTYEYDRLGPSSYKFDCAKIESSNLTTSGGKGSETVYNNFFNEKSSNAFDAFGTKGGGTGDHIGAAIKFNPENGQLVVQFQELQGNTKTGYGAGSDYNQLSFTFVDTAVQSPTDNNLYTTTRELTVSDLTIGYDRANSDGSSTRNAIADIGGRDDTFTAACYTKGTLITTATGEVAVEDLAVGDQVMTVSGALEPVIWLGNSTINCERQLHKDKTYPVRIVKDAFGANLPKRDLFLSPDHSVFIDGVMIPAYCLINGTTITQEMTETLVTYYHVELPQHQAILAEGLPAESYLETSEANRHFFKDTTDGTANTTSNITKMDLQYPACPENTPAWKHIWDTQGFAKLTQDGPVLAKVNKMLADRAQEINAKEVLQAA